MENSVVLIGYSGHSYVVIDIFQSQNQEIIAYCDTIKKDVNPYNLAYWGSEKDIEIAQKITDYNVFIAIGDNHIRRKIFEYLSNFVNTFNFLAINAIHSTSYVAKNVNLGNNVMVGAKTVINPCVTVGNGVICNTSAVIEHECKLGDFCHIAPNATLCGNVEIGENSFIGAGAVVKQGVKVGKNVIIGAGTVIVKNIPDNVKVVGNPQRIL
jgi:sugar O-acyltransferase (sialic acid O-acetyltransferase NeuD family)